MKASSLPNQIKFNCNPIFSKWAKPNIYGSGKLYELTLARSKLQHRSTGPALLTYNPSIALPLCKKIDEYVKPSHLKYDRLIVDMTDGGKVGVDKVTTDPKLSNSDYPNILYAVAGGMTSRSARSKIWANWFLEAGYPSVYIVNRRCASRVPQYSPQISVPCGKYNDLVDIMDFVARCEPGKRWILIGSCFGAAHVIEYFTQQSSNRPEILGGIVDSFQFNGRKFRDIEITSKIMLVRSASAYMAGMFVDSALNHAANEKVYEEVSQMIDRTTFENMDFSDVNSSESVIQLIRALCPDEKFDHGYEYYSKFSPYYDEMPYHHKNFLKITKPMVWINSQDDPFSPFDSEEVAVLKENPNLCLWLYPGGGHICFIERIYPYKSYLKDFYLENCRLLRESF